MIVLLQTIAKAALYSNYIVIYLCIISCIAAISRRGIAINTRRGITTIPRKKQIRGIEQMIDSRKSPDWAKHQTNGKTASENYREIIQKRQEALKEIAEYKILRKAQIDEEIDREIQGEIVPKIEIALDCLLREWQ